MSHRSPRSSAIDVCLAGGIIVLAGLLAYANSFGGEFVFDDLIAIQNNETIRRLWPPWPILSPPCLTSVESRPLVNLSLAINYRLGGLSVGGYHVFNLAVHLLVGLTLFGLVRRTLLTPLLGDRFQRSATDLALAISLIWIVHPLNTEAVSYIIQRTESMAGLFYLLTLYCVVRGAERISDFGFRIADFTEGRPGRADTERLFNPNSEIRDPKSSLLWYGLATLACLLGMASKQVVVSAPLAVLLYDRVFLAGSFAAALRRRWGLYVGLSAGWGLIGFLVYRQLSASQEALGSVGTTWWRYAGSQFTVILHYLYLSVWPRELTLDYAWPLANKLRAVLPQAIVVAGLLAGTIWALGRRGPARAAGFAAGCFFLVLAPTSSVLPLRDVAFEHRMYLPLAGLAALAVVAADQCWRRWNPRPENAWMRALAILVLAAVGAGLGGRTILRNKDYRNCVAMWRDVIAKRPDNGRAHYNLAYHLLNEQKIEEAITVSTRALELDPTLAVAHNNRGAAYRRSGDLDRALADFNRAIALAPGDPEAYCNRGIIYSELKQHSRAIAEYTRAIELDPSSAGSWSNRGIARSKNNDPAGAAEDFSRAIELAPRNWQFRRNRAVVNVALGRPEEAQADIDACLSLGGQIDARLLQELSRVRVDK